MKRHARWLNAGQRRACIERSTDVPDTLEACTVDTDCSAGVCARTGECLASADVRKAHVLWTMAGKAPDAQSCYWSPTVNVELRTDPEIGHRETWTAGPLPCTLGKFTVDKLPRRFWIGGVRSPSAGMWVPLDETGVAKVDLP